MAAAPQPENAPAAGDVQQRFLSLFTTNYDAIFAYVMVLTQDQGDAEEVMQETALALWREFDRYDPRLEFRPWARKFALTEVRRFRRGRPALTLSPEVIELLAADTERLTPEIDRQRERLAGCLGRLRPADRQLIELYYQPQQQARDLARQRGVTIHAIYKTIKRIRRQLLDCVRRTSAEAST